MTPELSFESLSFYTFLVFGDLTVNEELDPDVNFSQSISFLDTKCFDIDDTKTFASNNIT